MDLKKKFCEFSRPRISEYRSGRYRLGYHLMPICGWMNDPHGPVWHNGAYHFFCNVYPNDALHPFSGKYWAHFTTENLVDFSCLPPAIAPDLTLDCDGCASGCAVSLQDQLWLFYTARNRGASPSETQAAAVSKNGIDFVKINSSPLVCAPEHGNDFRDPYLFCHGNNWRMLLGNRADERGRVLVYSSCDLLHWKDEGVFCEKPGDYGFMWECPDYKQIHGKDFLILSPEGMPEKRHSTGYFTGLLQADGLRFIPDQWVSLDEGRDFYAPQSFTTPDGRTLLVAWMQKWFTDIPTAQEGWVGAVTIPRELSVGLDGLLEQRPARELLALRTSCETLLALRVTDSLPFLREAGDRFELRLLIDLSRSDAENLLLHANGACYRLELKNYLLHADFSQTGESPAPDVTLHLRRTKAQKLEIILFADSSSHELLLENGASSLTTRLYPHIPQNTLTLCAQGGTLIIENVILSALRKAEMDFVF